MKKFAVIILILAFILGIGITVSGCKDDQGKKQETKQEVKEETKEETKAEAKEETKEEAKTEDKEETKEETKTEAKEETKEETKPEVKQEDANKESERGDKMAANIYAIIKTDKGDMKLELFPDVAPNTVLNFVTLINKGYYNGLNFHRVVPGFVIQGGCPKGDGTGSPGYLIPAEFNKRKHLKGTLAMARAQDPDSAGSQFYICLEAQPFLDNQYTVFGQLVEGKDVPEKIRQGDKIISITIEGELPASLKGKELKKSKM